MKKIGELPAITDVPAGSLLIVNTENGTKKITYEDLCQAVKATLGIPTVVQSIDITEPGNIPDGPVIKAAFDSVNDLLLGAATYSAGKEIEMSWAELRAKIKTEDFSGLHIGDYKDIVLSTGEEARVDLSGFNTYMNVGDTAILTEPHLYFTFRDCLKTTYQMNSSNTNAGGTAAAALTATVNTTIYNTLPADLRAVMKEVRRLENNKGTWAWASRKLWLLRKQRCSEEITGPMAMMAEASSFLFLLTHTDTLLRDLAKEQRSVVLVRPGGWHLRPPATPPTSALSATAAMPTTAAHPPRLA